MIIMVAANIPSSGSKLVSACTEEWDGWEISTRRFGLAVLNDNGCFQIFTKAVRCKDGWQIWVARDRESFWDDSLEFIWSTLLRLVFSSERQMGKLLTFTLPDAVRSEIKAVHDSRWAGEGI